METNGQHLLIDAFDCQKEILNNAEELEVLLVEAINELDMEILSSHFHSFIPQGVTGIIGISTSHFSIHTWPEHGYAALDLYTCGDQDLWPTVEKILYKIQASRSTVYEIFRGNESTSNSVMKKINLPSNAMMAEKVESKQNFFELESPH